MADLVPVAADRIRDSSSFVMEISDVAWGRSRGTSIRLDNEETECVGDTREDTTEVVVGGLGDTDTRGLLLLFSGEERGERLKSAAEWNDFGLALGGEAVGPLPGVVGMLDVA